MSIGPWTNWAQMLISVRHLPDRFIEFYFGESRFDRRIGHLPGFSSVLNNVQIVPWYLKCKLQEDRLYVNLFEGRLRWKSQQILWTNPSTWKNFRLTNRQTRTCFCCLPTDDFVALCIHLLQRLRLRHTNIIRNQGPLKYLLFNHFCYIDCNQDILR